MTLYNKEMLMKRFQQELEIRNFSKKTIKPYFYALTNFLDGNPELTEQSVKNFIQTQINKKDPSTVSSQISALKFFFNRVLNKPLNIPHPKRNNKIPIVLTKEEITKLINSTNNIKHRLILKVLYGCGLRVSEIVKLNSEDFNFDEKLIHIKLSKGRKDRFVPIPRSISSDLQKYMELQNNKIAFPSQREKRLSIKTIQVVVSNAAKKAALIKKVHPHTLRHSYATHLLETGTDIRIIQKLLGHSDVKTTQIYLQVSQQTIKNIKSPLDNL